MLITCSPDIARSPSCLNDALSTAGSAGERLRRVRAARTLLLASVATLPLVLATPSSTAWAAAPAFVNLCTGLGVTLPVLQPVGAVANNALTGVVAPVLAPLNGVVGSINTNVQQVLSGQTIGVGVLDPTTNSLITTPNAPCKVSADAFEVTNGQGITIGGGQINGLGGSTNTQASAGDPTAIAFGNGASTANGVTNALALGTGASVTAANSVAIGANSSASRGANTFTAYGLKGTQSSVGNVSFGSSGNDRQLTHVAPGSAVSDAVNVAQLRGATNDIGTSITNILGGGATYDSTTNQIAGPSYTVNNTSYTTIGGAINALNGSIAAGPVQYSTAAAPTTANPGVVSNDVTLVGAAAGTPVALHNLARGTIAPNGTDAANTGQLYASNSSIAAIIDGGATYNTTTGAITNPTFTIQGKSYTTIGSALNALVSMTTIGGSTGDITTINNGTIGPFRSSADSQQQLPAASGTDSVAGGFGSVASADQTTAVGNGSQATVAGATAIGMGAIASADPTTAVGVNAHATANEASAFGGYANAASVNSTALGRSATATGYNSVALGAFSADGGQDNVVSVGTVGGERRIINVTAGTLSSTSTDAVNGSQLYATNNKVASLGHTAVQYDTDGSGNTLSSVTLSSDQGGPVIIHNLAPGVALNDAATVGQIQAAAQNPVQYDTVDGVRTNTVALVGGSSGPVTITNLAAGINPTDAANVAQVQGATAAANVYTDQKFSSLAALSQRQLARVRSDAAGGTALALAATGLRYDDAPGKISIGGATSYYNSQMGLAFGIGGTTEDGRIRFNAAVTASPTMVSPSVGAVVGASVAIN